MTAGWTVRLERRAEKDLSRLSAQNRSRVLQFLYQRLLSAPSPRALGAPLNGPLGALWKYRVGDLRVIADIRDGDVLILVVQIGNRREVYR
jgi:mRNA interferase RelE/StbE